MENSSRHYLKTVSHIQLKLGTTINHPNGIT